MPTSTFFKTPAEFRAWFAKNAPTEPELIVGFYKRGSGQASITWPESVEEALFRKHIAAWKFFEAQLPG